MVIKLEITKEGTKAAVLPENAQEDKPAEKALGVILPLPHTWHPGMVW